MFKIIQQQEGFTAFVPGSTQVNYSKCLYCKVCLIGFGSFSSNQPPLRHSHALGGVLNSSPRYCLKMVELPFGCAYIIASFTTLKQDNMGLYPRELTLALQVVLLILAGEFCEVTLETPCKDGWFGIPSIGICGPCMCDVGLHLSPVCNRTTGECYCKVREHRWLHAWPNDWANMQTLQLKVLSTSLTIVNHCKEMFITEALTRNQKTCCPRVVSRQSLLVHECILSALLKLAETRGSPRCRFHEADERKISLSAGRLVALFLLVWNSCYWSYQRFDT